MPETDVRQSTVVAPARPLAQEDEGDHERMTHIVLEGFKPKCGGFFAVGPNVVE